MSPTILVPLVLLGLCLLMGSAGPRLVVARRRRQAHARRRARDMVKRWMHAINEDRCTGCEGCIGVCPTGTLGLVHHKSAPVNPERCIECRQCAQVCPTMALVMHREGEEPPAVRVPDLDDYWQTRVRGQYLIGEVAGKPLVKNAANTGRLVVEHMIAEGLVGRRGDGSSEQSPLDVLVVGSGPGGLSAGLACQHHGLSVTVIEKDAQFAATVTNYPKGKRFLAEPELVPNLSFLPVFDASKEDLLATWSELLSVSRLDVRYRTTVEGVAKISDGLFRVETNSGTLHARRVVLAIGRRGKPRTLGVPGESLVKVSNMLVDPDAHRGQNVLVVGGGDSALESACALADAGASSVVLSYRGSSFARAKSRNRTALQERVKRGKIEVLYRSNIAEITDDRVVIQLSDGRILENDAVYVLIGADAPVRWLEKVGVTFVERPHSYRSPAPETMLRRLGIQTPCPTDVGAAMAAITGRSLPPPAPAARQRRWLQPIGSDHNRTLASSGRQAPLEMPYRPTGRPEQREVSGSRWPRASAPPPPPPRVPTRGRLSAPRARSPEIVWFEDDAEDYDDCTVVDPHAGLQWDVAGRRRFGTGGGGW